VPRQTIVELFSDIPENYVDSAINTLAAQHLLRTHDHEAGLSVISQGIA
jgi:hypothetical protein